MFKKPKTHSLTHNLGKYAEKVMGQSSHSLYQCNIMRMRDKTKIRIVPQNGKTLLEFVMLGILLNRHFYVRFEMKFNYVVSKMNINSISWRLSNGVYAMTKFLRHFDQFMTRY